MQTKEPYFDASLTPLGPAPQNAAALKIPLSSDDPFVAKVYANPLPSLTRRRPSMEPYYTTPRGSRVTTSSLSSYAKLSDVFDYHHLESTEDALVSDSDYDSTDECLASVDTKRSESVSRMKVRPALVDLDDSDSELLDYKVHLLTFKVTSQAQYTRPPRTSRSRTSDCFDENPFRAGLSEFSATSQPGVQPPSFVWASATPFYELPAEQLTLYLDCCSRVLVDAGPSRRMSAPSCTNKITNDCYDSPYIRRGSSDAYATSTLYNSFI